MRSGDLDALVKFVRPGPLERQGRSRVPVGDVLVADLVPCHVTGGQGSERFANAENAASAPFIITVRREPDLDDLDAGDVAILVESGRRLDIKSVRPGERDPRRDLEILAVGDAAP